jgi:HAD superfamily hydrolase (TIGR01549 family)
MSQFFTRSEVPTLTPAERRYRTVIFDVGGTLLGFEDNKPFQEFLDIVDIPHHFISGEDLRLNMLHMLSARRNEAVGMGNGDQINEWWRSIFDELFPKCPHMARAMWELFKCHYFESLFPDTLPALQRLHLQGVPMGIISNYSKTLLDLLIQFELYRYFDFAIVSANEGVAKPDPQIFKLGLAAARVSATEALYVGDNVIDDIEGANNVGMDAVLINRPGRQPSTAPLMIDSLLDIEKLVFPQLMPGTSSCRPYWSNDSALPIPPLPS